MNKNEIKEFLEKPEVLAYLKENLQLILNVDPCEDIYGYDITAKVMLFGKILAKEKDCI